MILFALGAVQALRGGSAQTVYVCPGKLTVPSPAETTYGAAPGTAAACGVQWPRADCVAEGLWLPQLHVGDWLVFENMGAILWAWVPLRDAQTCRITYAMGPVAW